MKITAFATFALFALASAELRKSKPNYLSRQNLPIQAFI